MADDTSFEREKWQAEIAIRKNELLLKEREQNNRDAELLLKTQDHRASAWRNPLIIAIFATALAAAGNAAVAFINGMLQRDLESMKADSARLIESMKTGDVEKSAENLGILSRLGLISDPKVATKIQTYLANRKVGTGFSLPAPDGRLHFEENSLISKTQQESMQAILQQYFTFLQQIGFATPKEAVNIIIEKLGTPNAYYSAANRSIRIDVSMAGDNAAALNEYTHHMLISARNGNSNFDFSHLELALANYFSASFLNNPKIGETYAKQHKLAKPYLRTLDNKRPYSKSTSASNYNSIMNDNMEMWGGLFWDLRKQLTSEVADPMIANAWMNFRSPPKNSDITIPFLQALLQAASMQSTDSLRTVKKILKQRKFPAHKAVSNSEATIEE